MKLDFSQYTGVESGSVATAKAVLHFYPQKEDPVQTLNGSSRKNAGTPQLSADAAVTDRTADAMAKTHKNPDQMKEKVKKAGNMSDDRFYTVAFQFNPAAIRISAYGGGMAPIKSFGAKEGDKDGDEEESGSGQVDYGPVNETVTVSFKVVFDAGSYTVRPLAEGFLAAVRSSSRRRVIFRWGDKAQGGLEYGGFLNHVQCRYTMFDAKGEAVRAEIDLSLVTGNHDTYDDVKEWRNRYDAFMRDRNRGPRLQEGAFEALGGGLAGQVEKAYILFHTRSEDPKAVEGNVKGKTLLKPEVYKGLSNMTAKLSDAAGKVTGKTADSPDPGKTAGGEEYAAVRIQYNPVSVTLQSRGGEMMTRDGGFGGAGDFKGFQKNAIPAETVLSMELLFDGTNVFNGFLADTDMGYSVAPVSELFASAIASAYSRLVCVVWNRMTFWGELCEVDVEYTMFSKKGNPIRSKVSIRIRQDGESAKEGAAEKHWEKAYNSLENEAKRLIRS